MKISLCHIESMQFIYSAVYAYERSKPSKSDGYSVPCTKSRSTCRVSIFWVSVRNVHLVLIEKGYSLKLPALNLQLDQNIPQHCSSRFHQDNDIRSTSPLNHLGHISQYACLHRELICK